LFVTAFCTVLAVSARSESEAVPEVRICTSGAFFPAANIKDTRVAMQVWLSRLSAKMEIPCELALVIIDDVKAVTEAAKSGAIDLIALPSLAYVEMRKEVTLEPFVVALGPEDGHQLDRFVLMRHGSSGIAELADLRDKRLLISTIDRGMIAMMWLDVLLMDAGLEPAAEYLQSVEIRDTASQAILPTFFGQADACIVDTRALETVRELNPQVTRELTTVASSPEYLTRLMCVRSDFDATLREILLRATLRLRDEKEGEQILVLLQAENPAPYRPEYLDGVLELIAEHKALTEAARGRVPASR
jgi:ABC-type phosphate/phosphonate transport system substrate-binding protein